MPHWAHNKMPTSVKQRYFELIRAGHRSDRSCSNRVCDWLGLAGERDDVRPFPQAVISSHWRGTREVPCP